jgi:hypothetical protein
LTAQHQKHYADAQVHYPGRDKEPEIPSEQGGNAPEQACHGKANGGKQKPPDRQSNSGHRTHRSPAERLIISLRESPSREAQLPRTAALTLR